MAAMFLALALLEVNVVEQEVCVEDEDEYGPWEGLPEDLAVVLGVVVEKIEDNNEMLIQNCSGPDMQEYTQHCPSTVHWGSTKTFKTICKSREKFS